MKYKKLKLSLLLLGLSLTIVHAQEAFTSAGGDFTDTGGSVSYSAGQVVYNTYTETTGSVAQGVQQPYEISVVTGIEKVGGTDLMVSVYPNPATDYLTLRLDAATSADTGSLKYQLFDINGKLLESKKIEGEKTNIAMSNFVPATYFLRVIDNKKEIKNFKIIIN